jgi:EAL domain-containing protein (putative c-di-GMP-specific phosphodiesterase class I)
MDWNFDYDFAAILVIGLLILYTLRRKDLPLIRNGYFMMLMVATFCVAFTDIIASVFTSLPNSIPLWLLYLCNNIYYMFLGLSPLAVIFYCYAVTKEYHQGLSLRRLLALTPFVTVVLLVISTSWTGLVYTIDENLEFHYGPLRIAFFIETGLYFFWALVHVIYHRRSLRALYRYSIYSYLFLTWVGHVFQVFLNPYTQTVSLGASLGLLVIYLSFQNPQMNRDKGSGMFSREGLIELQKSEVSSGNIRNLLMIQIADYKEMQTLYGTQPMLDVVEQVSAYTREYLPGEVFFYMHGGLMILAGNKHSNFYRVAEIMRGLTTKPVHTRIGDVKIRFQFAEVPKAFAPPDYQGLKHLIILLSQRFRAEPEMDFLLVTEEMKNACLREQEIEEALARACSGDGLEVFYQPIYSSEKKRIHSAEALVRIRDPKLGLIFPDEFIWRAESNGSIITLGQKVFEEVCRFIMGNDMEALGLDYIEINLSPFQCLQDQLADQLEETMKRFGIDPGRINLEITESAAVDTQMLRNNMEKLTRIGVSFALDDYGTGYSNLVSVMSLPLQIIKIDKSIVWAYFSQGNDLLVQVINTFRGRSMKLICEGVETKEMSEQLEALGCDYQQGYYFSRPVPESEFLKLIRPGSEGER